MRVARTFGVLAVVGALTFVGARAQSVEAAGWNLTWVPEAGPVLSGQRLLFADGAQGGVVPAPQTVTLKVIENGGIQTLATVAASDSKTEMIAALAASSSRVAFEVGLSHPSDPPPPDGPPDTFMVLAGPLGGPLSPPGPWCETPNDLSAVRSFDVSAHTLAFPAADCQHATVVDYGAQPPVTTTVSARALVGLRVAGRYAAWLQVLPPGRGDIVVYDLMAGHEAYRIRSESIPTPFNGLYPGWISSLSLQADGRMAIAYTFPHGHALASRIAWASPDQHQLRVLGIPAAGHYAVKLVGDRLLVLRSPTYTTGSIDDGTLEFVDLKGNVTHVVATGVSDRLLHESFDSDGSRVVFIRRGCDHATLFDESVSARTNTANPARGCRLRLMSRPQLTRNGPIVAAISCKGLAADCVTEDSVASVVGRNGQRVIVARGNLSVGNVASLYPTPAGLRWIAHHARLQIRLSMTVGDPSFIVSGDVGATQQRTTTTTVVRTRA